MKTYKLHLSPYGTFEHPEGHQSISSADAQHCIRKTRTWQFRLGLKKIPVYLGHPDDPLFQKEHSDMHIYGYVKNLCADEDGLWVFVKLTKYGRTLLRQSPKCRYLSPRWVLCKTENQAAYHPERLLSVGLTQHPNLPVQPIVFDERKLTFRLCTFLRFLTKRRVSSKTSHTKKSDACSEVRLRKVFSTFVERIRRAFVKKIKPTTPTLEPKFPALLPASEEDTFSGLRTPLSSDLRGAQTREEKRRILQFGQAVQARMKATGESYPEAWNVLLHQTPAVFENNHSEETQDERSDGSKTRPRSGNFVPQSLKPMTVTE